MFVCMVNINYEVLPQKQTYIELLLTFQSHKELIAVTLPLI